MEEIIEKVTNEPKIIVPEPKISEGDAYYKVKHDMINEIVEKRIYKDDDLQDLFRRTSKKHKDLNRDKIYSMWKAIVDDLNA